MNDNMNIVSNMEALARKWHDGQFRKGPKHLPYIVHPKAVVQQLKEWGFSEELNPIVLAIGWGHDLFEDTDATVSEVLEACGTVGSDIVSGIKWLTFNRCDWPEAESKEQAKAMYIANIASNAPPEILVVKLADRICNIRDFAELYGERSEKVRSYYWEAESLFNNIRRLPHELKMVVSQTLVDIEHNLVFPDIYDLRDEWTDSFYIVKDPPTAYGYLFEGRFGWDGMDFSRSISEDEFDSWKIRKKVPQYIAEAYCKGEIKVEDIDWDS